MATALAIAAAAVAVAAVVFAGLAWLKLRAVRAGQSVLLGRGKDDLVDFAVSLQGRIADLSAALDEVAAGLARVDQRVDSTVSHASIIRYDAYAGTGGHQSSTVALLDSTRTGVLISAIQGRDYARIYMKQIERGRSSIALSPEEQEAVERAMTP